MNLLMSLPFMNFISSIVTPPTLGNAMDTRSNIPNRFPYASANLRHPRKRGRSARLFVYHPSLGIVRIRNRMERLAGYPAF